MDGVVEPQAESSEFLIGEYRISSEPLSMSTRHSVHRAVDGRGRAVIVKRGGTPDALRAESEALRAVSRVPVASVPAFIEFVEDGGEAALVEEYVDGRPLGIPKRGDNFARLRPYEVRRFLEHMLQTLKVVHGQGYVHNDVTPSNIVCRPNDPVHPYTLIDFGSAERRGAAGRYRSDAQSDTQVPAEYLAYAAPERILGNAGYYCGDLYSLGVIAIQLLTGAELTDLHWNSHGHVVLPLYPFHKDPVLERVLITMTCAHPGQRYSDADEVLAGLSKSQAGEILDKPAEKSQTPRLVLALVLFIVFVFLASLAWKSAMADYCRRSVDCHSSTVR